MARPRDPTALKVLKGKSHLTKDEMARIAEEVYASEGEIAPPDYLTDKRMQKMFNKHAAYMHRVNKESGVAVYGDTDIETLAVMVLAHFRYLQYQQMENKATDPAERARFNQMKNREAATQERFMRLLKLDPSSRVDFGAASDGDTDGEDEF